MGEWKRGRISSNCTESKCFNGRILMACNCQWHVVLVSCDSECVAL
jgi:hypothetical protein